MPKTGAQYVRVPETDTTANVTTCLADGKVAPPVSFDSVRLGLNFGGLYYAPLEGFSAPHGFAARTTRYDESETLSSTRRDVR